jgi:hypothetical protein
MNVKSVTVHFVNVAERAGFVPGPDGKLNLPPTQDTADRLAAAAAAMVGGEWHPGDDRFDVVLTGAGPVWGHLAIAHALHGRVVRLMYEAPNASIVIFSHGL